jgi:DNA polymerase elongation subunit (family B)
MTLEPIEFQIYDWQEDHEFDDEEDEDSSDQLSTDMGSYIIHTFGRTLEGKSVYMRIINYTPHFYIKLPLTWAKAEANNNVKKMYSYLISDLNKKIWKKFRSSLIDIDVIEKMAAEGFNNGKKFLFARLIFNNMISMKKFKYMFEETSLYIPGIMKTSMQFKTYEANLPPMLRCFHIKKISGCSWVSINKYVKIKEEDCDSYCDIELRVDWRDINPIEKDTNAPLRILSFDIECYSSDKDKFPQAKNKADCIFQIGSTYTYLNESVPYRQHIVCLKETDNIEGSIVEWYNTERDMLEAWIKELITQDCDIITGWNIFGFDEGYIYDRCVEHLNLENEILKISKLKNYKCIFRDFKLESAAFGQNKIRMFGTPGRIHIDLMKDVQKNFKLNSYKLDMVASNFIRNEIYKIEKDGEYLKLYCDGIESIYKEDFIHIEYALDFISEMIGYKYMILNVDDGSNKILTIKPSDILLEYLEGDQYTNWLKTNRKERQFKIFWSQAKDDVGPKDIFRMYNGTSKERAIVAKYCIKDCTLINLLIDKLCVVTNNIEMANVCYVPMSFLFTRGQLIKLFSLCLKNYRDAGYLFPVLKKPDEKLPSYEGAIVFDPEANVEYEALAVKDYASLYPSSIIHKNMSHETIIKSDKYDNIPDVTYFNSQFKDHDNTIQHRRFAKIGDELGVVPKTLRNLIAERNAVKKVMKSCKDQFKYKILDGKQLALKITANSLYGALGADVSPIFQRDIAACTTSTGREMLKLARHFDENIVPGLINGYRYALYNKDEEKANKILEMEMNPNESKEKIKKYVMNDIKNLTFQPIIRYGDSVIGSTPLLLRNSKTNKIYIESINNLGDDTEYSEMTRINTEDIKESFELNNIETWTEKGWTNVQRVIRHKLSPNKKLFRITTHTGSVVVTDDHSLLNLKGEIISPKDIKIGDELLHSFPEINNNYEYTFYNGIKLNKDIAQFLGMFMGDGSCGNYNCLSGNKASFAINNASDEIIKKYQDIGNQYFNNFDWVKLDTLESSGVYKLVPKNKTDINSKTYGNIKKFIVEIRTLMYTNDSQKKVPEFILNASKDIREAFLIGLYDADGYKTNYGNVCKNLYENNLSKVDSDKIRCGSQIDQKGMVASFSIYTLCKSLGYEVSINTRKDKMNIYRIRLSEKLRKNPNKIKKIEEWTFNEEYVYDLTTDNHHFHAGVGSLIVHNTDSIFSCYRFREDVKQVKETAALPLWKDIISFSKRLLLYFIPEEYKQLWKDCHDKYYNDDLVNLDNGLLRVPQGPAYIEPPNHYKDILMQPIEIRMEQFLLHYMEESFMPWLWIIQDIFTKKYVQETTKKNAIEMKLFNNGISLVEKMNLVVDLNDDIKEIILEDVEYFISNKLKTYIIQPYWDINYSNSTNNIKIVRVRFYKHGTKIIDKRTLTLSIDMGVFTGELVKKRLPFPHDLEYEKTFWPFLILTKKRYVGNKYEFNPDKYKQDYNGIVLKRRDNAPIVKEICGGIINRLIDEKDPDKARKYIIDCMNSMFNNEYNIKYFLTSKTLKMKESYADWTKIAHIVLAERISQRDPGNCPQSGDRIEFAAVQLPNITKKTLQGERIETPQYIKEKNLKIDFEFYMTNQIMNPALQFLSLVIPNAEEIFDKFKIRIENEKKGRSDIMSFITKRK